MNNVAQHETPKKEVLSYEQLLLAEPHTAQELFNNLSVEEQLSVVLSAPWEKRQKLILLAQNPDELIQALPEEELYWTIKETGIADALPLIARISFEQMQYILDIDCWNKDRIEMSHVVEWLQVMLRCHEKKVHEWLIKTDEQFLNFIFKKLFTISKLREDMDPVEVADQLPSWTLDGMYYFHFADDDARVVCIPFLHLLYKTDSTLFYRLMENTIWSFEAELEEELFRLRQSRVAEKGFPELEEALQVYQYMRPEQIEPLLKPLTGVRSAGGAETSSQLKLRHVMATGRASLFLWQMVRLLDDRPALDRIQRELIHTANQVIVADGLEARDISCLKKALQKVLGYSNIGLEVLSKQDEAAAQHLLESLPMRFLFRVGYSQALDLQRRLQRIDVTRGCAHGAARRHFFDGIWGATIEGLSQIRPRYYEGNSRPDGFLFRDFESLDEILATRRVLDIVAVAEKLFFDALGIPVDQLIKPPEPEQPTAEPFPVQARPLFLTVLARQVLSGATAFVPLTAKEMQRFLAAVFIRNETGAVPPYVIKTEFCQQTREWVKNLLHPSDQEQAAVEAFVESCLELLQEQCGGLVENESLDTRFITAVIFNT